MNRISLAIASLLLLSGPITAVASAQGQTETIDAARVDAHVRALTTMGHRLAGSDEGRRAGDYIVSRLKELGFADSEILIQPFPVTTIARDRNECYLQIGDKKVLVEPLRPNMLALPVTGPEGVEAQTVYLHDASGEHLAGKTIAGRIAVLDYAAGERWLDVIRQKALAVVFVGPTRHDADSPVWVQANLQFPRVYLDRQTAQANGLLSDEGVKAKLMVRMGFRRSMGRNIVALVPAAGQSAPEGSTVALTCAYDTYGPIPFASPSPRKAANVAGLIEMAGALRRRPAKRASAVIFFDANAQGGIGQMQMHFARLTSGVTTDNGGVIGAMLADREREAQLLQWGLDTLADGKADELIAAGGGSYLGWRDWLPVLITGVCVASLMGLGLWFVLDFVAWRMQTRRISLWILGRVGWLAIAIVVLMWTNQTDFRAWGRGVGDAGDVANARAFEYTQLLNFVAQRYEDRREYLSDLRLARWELERDVHRAEGAVEKWRNQQEDPNAVAPVYLTDRIVQAQASLEAKGEAMDAEIDRAENRRRRLGNVRIAMMEGRVPEATDGELALYRSLIAERVDLYRARLAEITGPIGEQVYLNGALATGRKWAPLKLHAMLYVNLAPTAAPWAPVVPPPMAGRTVVTTEAMGRWVQNWVASAVQRGDGHLTAPPKNLVRLNEMAWRVSAQAAYLLPLESPGAVWPDEALPDEPPAQAQAAAVRLSEVLAFCRKFHQQRKVDEIKTPKTVNRFFFRYPRWNRTSRRYDACYVRRYGGGAVEAEIAAPGVTLFIGTKDLFEDEYPADQWKGHLTTSSQVGTYWQFIEGRGNATIVGATTDEYGRINRMTQFHPARLPGGGAQGWNTPGAFDSKSASNRLCLFDATALPFVGLRSMREKEFKQMDALTLEAEKLRVIRAEDDVDFPRMNLTYDKRVAVAWVHKLRRFKLLTKTPLLLNSTPYKPTGDGYARPAQPIDVLRQSREDLYALNESRLSRLRAHRIEQSALERIHWQAGYHADLADKFARTDPAKAQAHDLAALALSRLVYEPVRDTTNDLIQAVVILLLLAIPFAFAVERVIVGTPNIYRQILGFAVIFLSVFVILYFVHPAFRFATFPMLVLLAFIIIILSGLVIWIMKAKFEYEVRKLQGIATASHQSTRTARQTIGAAVTQGIASMRRRPVRTALTALTITLLTFTIMFFGSFNAAGAVQRIRLGLDEKAPRVEIQLSGGRPLDGETVATLRRLWAGEAESFSRSWTAVPGHRAIQTGEKENLEGKAEPIALPNGKTVGARAWVEMDRRDLQLYPAVAEALQCDPDAFFNEGGILLPNSVAGDLPIGSKIHFNDRTWTLRGTFDPRRLRAVKTISGASFVPPDIVQQRNLLGLRYSSGREADALAIKKGLRQMDPDRLPLIDEQSVVLLADPNRPLDALATSVVILPKTSEAAERIAADAATLIDEPVLAVAHGQVQRVFYTMQVTFTGLRKLITPLILGGLIIFGTMLSSVTDRKREVFTLSALGLAPVHVAILFFAEAAVYSVIGGLAGYLLSQVFSKVTEYMAQFGWVAAAPPMNYSSMNAMASILLVMATVMVSTVYPAFKAARSANPGIQRKWRMPAPDGDKYNIKFPFTVSQYDMIGLISFLEEYFVSHQDRSVGSFAADEVRVEYSDERFSLRAKVWLQPFDQGVCQEFVLETLPSDIEGIDEVSIQMHRTAGPPVIWRRSCNVFIEDIRQQFIFWRTIDEDAVEHYHDNTVRRFGLATDAGEPSGEAAE